MASALASGAHEDEGGKRLLTGLPWDEVPDWLRFPYILRGYRWGGDAASCWASLFSRKNNEGFNAWSMILSLAAGTCLLVFYLAAADPQPRGLDALPFVALWLGQAVHHPFSVAYHVLLPISPEVYNTWRKRDMAMIFFLNLCSAFAMSWFTWGRWPTAAVTAVVACACAWATHDILSLTAGRQLRRGRIVALVFVSLMGLYAPVVYRAARAALVRRFGFELYGAISLASCHGVAAACYATHFPERVFPNVFDLFGNSHNLMHVLLFVIFNVGYPYLHVLYRQHVDGAWKAAV